MRYYHLLSRGKRVKEISLEQYRKLVWTNSLVIARAKTRIHVRKGGDCVTVPLCQLYTIFTEGFKEESS